MTEKQREYIETICEWLGIDYEGDDTKESAGDFIRSHESEFKKVYYQWRRENCYEWRRECR